MARKRDLEFFECGDCKSLTLLGTSTSARTCPGCGAANGRVISSSELERRTEHGAVFSIDPSPGGRDESERQ